MFLAYARRSSSTNRATDIRARYEFCLNCLHAASRAGTPVVIRAVWSLVPVTHCHFHHRPLIPCCPRCSVEDPLFFPTLLHNSRVRCRSCGISWPTDPQPFDQAPHMHFVLPIEKAYLAAIDRIRPASLGFEQLSGQAFRELVEYFVLLFSKPSSHSSHILARYFVDWDIVFRYFHIRQVAEARRELFSWRWRYAVMYCVAVAICGHPKTLGASATSDSKHWQAIPFRHLLPFVSPVVRLEMAKASGSWPEPLQRRLWLAVELFEGRTWRSPNSLRLKCQSESPG
jgi:hypothetical protein